MKKIKDRISETSNIPQELLSEYPPIPKTVKIEITSRCDLKCFFCSVTYKKQDGHDIDPDLLFKLLRDAKDAGVQEVGLFWLGEPLLVKQLPEYVAYAKKIGISYVFITTNGRLAIPEKILPLIESGIDSIKFSINANGCQQYKEVCGVDAFDQVVANVKAMKTLRGKRTLPAIYASTVYDPNNPQTYKELKVLLRPYVDQHYPLRLYGDFSYKQVTSIGEGLTVEKQAITARTLESMMPCWSLFTLPHISFDGYLSVCYCDHDERFYMGDLKKVSFKEVWHSAKLAELRRKHLNKITKGHACENCIAYKTS